MALRLHPNQSNSQEGPVSDRNTFVPQPHSFDQILRHVPPRASRSDHWRDCYLHPQITPDLIEEFKDKRLADGARAATVNRDLAVLRRMLKLAERSDSFPVVHFTEVEFPGREESPPKATHRYLRRRRTHPEVGRSPHSNLDRPAIGKTGMRSHREALVLEVGRY